MRALLESYITSLVEQEMGMSSVKELEAKYRDKTDYLHVSEGKDYIQLSNIVIKKEFRGQGVGSRFMRDLTGYADRVHKVVTLSPTSEFGSSLGRLKGVLQELWVRREQGKTEEL